MSDDSPKRLRVGKDVVIPDQFYTDLKSVARSICETDEGFQAYNKLNDDQGTSFHVSDFITVLPLMRDCGKLQNLDSVKIVAVIILSAKLNSVVALLHGRLQTDKERVPIFLRKMSSILKNKNQAVDQNELAKLVERIVELLKKKATETINQEISDGYTRHATQLEVLLTLIA